MSYPNHTPLRLLFLGAALLAPPLAAATAPANSARTPSSFRPFRSMAGAEQGYLATQTLSRPGLKTDLRDIGSALTIFTEQMMKDLAVNNINDVLNFRAQHGTFYNRLTEGGNGNDFINTATQYVTRGGTTTTVARIFSRTTSRRIAITRRRSRSPGGPTPSCSGSAIPPARLCPPPSGRRTARPLRSSFKPTIARAGASPWTTIRSSGKISLSLRYAGLYSKLNGFREPSETFQRRHFVTTRISPFMTTVVRLNYEQGHLRIPAMRPWPVYDSLSPWLAAGSPLLATLGAPKPAGISNYTFTSPLSTQFSPAGTQVPPMRWLNQGQTALADWTNGFPVASPPSRRSFINPTIYPTTASVFGMSAYRLTDFKIASVFVEQQITRDFFVEAAVNRVVSDVVGVNGFSGDNDILLADVNPVLPNGAPNPNVGNPTRNRTPTS